jgi:F0F1-type ATP synthase membrane subunit b/b'
LIESAGSEISTEAGRASAELPGRIERLARALVEKVLGRKLAA